MRLSIRRVLAAAVLAVDVLVVFTSVIFRYFLRDPL